MAGVTCEDGFSCMAGECVMDEPLVCQPPFTKDNFRFEGNLGAVNYWNFSCACCLEGDQVCLEDDTVRFAGVDCQQDRTLCPG